jgi:hypothetical protein
MSWLGRTRHWSGRPKRHAFWPPLTAGVCAVHAVLLGSASLLSRWTWSRRTREAQGPHGEVGSEGSVERTCGARDTHRIGGVVRPGRAGTQPRSPPSTGGRCFLHPAPRHRREDRFPREPSPVPRDVACHGNGLRAASAPLRLGAASAAGIGGTRRVPKAGTGERRGPGGWTAAGHLRSRWRCPWRSKGVKPRLEPWEDALQLATKD